MKKISSLTPFSAAIIGLLSVVPFLVVNILVMNQFKPLISILRPNGVTSTFEIAFLFCLAVIFPLLGAYIALNPMFRKEKKVKKHKRKLYVLNTIVAVFLVLGVVMITKELSKEIYACDIVSIVNCD